MYHPLCCWWIIPLSCHHLPHLHVQRIHFLPLVRVYWKHFMPTKPWVPMWMVHKTKYHFYTIINCEVDWWWAQGWDVEGTHHGGSGNFSLPSSKKKAFKLSLLTGPTHGVYVLNVPWQAIRDVHKFYILVELVLWATVFILFAFISVHNSSRQRHQWMVYILKAAWAPICTESRTYKGHLTSLWLVGAWDFIGHQENQKIYLIGT